jgi:uncharacterized protein YegL
MVNYLKIKDGLFLVNQNIKPEAQKEKVVDVNTQHIFVIDCSGSMSGELSTIRKDLYNKITTLLKPGDSVTIIWFSGRNEFGVLIEDYNIKGAISFEKLRELINKYLTPQGLTAFVQPLKEVKKVVERVGKANPNMLHSMFFLTDGCDNQYSKKEIIEAVGTLKDCLNGATFVEYGWYCNKELLNQMAIEVGGIHTFSENFQDYEPYLTKQFTNDNKGKRKYVELSFNPQFDIAFNIQDGDVVSYKPNEKNEILLNVDKEVNVFYFTNKEPKNGSYIGDYTYVSKNYLQGNYKNDTIIQGLYASLFAFSRMSDYNMVSEILKTLGDAYLIKIKSNTFGTQKINELEAKFLEAINDGEKRFIEGYNPNLEPAEDAYCVMDMLDDLMMDDDNFWYPQHEAFKYKRIGSKAVSKAGKISDEDKKKLELLLSEGKLGELTDAIEEAKNKAGEELEFHYENNLQPSPISDLVWNETRANLSVLVYYKGHVVIPTDKAKEYNLPEKFNTQIFRNYTIIKDGIIHTYRLPVSLSENTFNKLQSQGLLKGETFEKGKIYVLDFSELPVINRQMVKTLSAKELFENQWKLVNLQAKNTVFNHYKKRYLQGLSKDFIELYGKEATEWLKSVGITSSGFNPPKTLEKQNEEISVNVLEIKMDKLTLPTAKKDFESIEKKVESGAPLTPREALLEGPIKEFKAFESMLKGTTDTKILESWLSEKSKNFRAEKTKLMSDISKAKFLTIVGKNWFKEFNSRNENEMTLNLDSKDIRFIVEDKMETIKL